MSCVLWGTFSFYVDFLSVLSYNLLRGGYMAFTAFGDFLKQLRIAKGYTQEQVAEGLCTREHISKIENGIKHPSHHIMIQLLYRLGVDPRSLNINSLSTENKTRIEYESKFKALMATREYSLAEELINEMREAPRLKNEEGELLINSLLSWLLHDTKQYEKAIEVLEKTIKFTRPDYSIENIQNYFFTNHELHTFNLLAATYYRTGKGYDVTVSIFNAIKKHLEAGLLFSESDNQFYLMIMYNLAYLEQAEGRYEEALKYSQEFILIAKQKNHVRYLCNFSRLIALSKIKLAKHREAEMEGAALYRKYLYLVYGLDDTALFDEGIKEYKELTGQTFGIKE